MEELNKLLGMKWDENIQKIQWMLKRKEKKKLFKCFPPD